MINLIGDALHFIRKNEPPEGYAVFMSGGKDSIVTLDLVKRSGMNYEAFYNMTLIDPPEVVSFIRQNYPEVKFLKPDGSFWKLCLTKGMPLGNQRWCCDKLKHATKSVKAIPLKHHILGLRKQESWMRAHRPRIEEVNGITKYKPIFDWRDTDVWRYIKTNNLSYPSLYDKGFTRLGCVVCPMDKSSKNNRLKRATFPAFYRVLDITLNKIWEERKERLMSEYDFTYEEFMRWPQWLKREQRKQGNLFVDNTSV